MSGKSKRAKLPFNDEQRKYLKAISQSRTVPIRETQRAQILLKYENGESIYDIKRSVKVRWITNLDVQEFQCFGRSQLLLANGALMRCRTPSSRLPIGRAQVCNLNLVV